MNRALLPFALVALVAGCRDNPEPPAQNMGAAQTALETNVVDPIFNEAANSVESGTLENAVDGADAVMKQGALPPLPDDVTYLCNPEMTLSTRYAAAMATSEEGAGDDSMIVMLNGTAYRMTLVRSASGARYATDKGRTAGMRLIWWNKGKEGTLREAKVGAEDATDTIIATCTEKGG